MRTRWLAPAITACRASPSPGRSPASWPPAPGSNLPNGKRAQSQLDAEGRLTRLGWWAGPAGQQVEKKARIYAFDAQKRPWKTTDIASDDPTQYDVTLTFTGYSRVSSITDGPWVTSLGYDALGHLDWLQGNLSPTAKNSIHLTNNPFGEVTRVEETRQRETAPGQYALRSPT